MAAVVVIVVLLRLIIFISIVVVIVTGPNVVLLTEQWPLRELYLHAWHLLGAQVRIRVLLAKLIVGDWLARHIDALGLLRDVAAWQGACHGGLLSLELRHVKLDAVQLEEHGLDLDVVVLA